MILALLGCGPKHLVSAPSHGLDLSGVTCTSATFSQGEFHWQRAAGCQVSSHWEALDGTPLPELDGEARASGAARLVGLQLRQPVNDYKPDRWEVNVRIEDPPASSVVAVAALPVRWVVFEARTPDGHPIALVNTPAVLSVWQQYCVDYLGMLKEGGVVKREAAACDTGPLNRLVAAAEVREAESAFRLLLRRIPGLNDGKNTLLPKMDLSARPATDLYTTIVVIPEESK